MLENIPLDLKIELGKLIHMEKFTRVKKELLYSTDYIHGCLQRVDHDYYNQRKHVTIRPTYFKLDECDVVDQLRESGIIIHNGEFVWALCSGSGEKIIENEFSIAGRNHTVIKEYLLKNESSK
jgi:hypothetical protein